MGKSSASADGPWIIHGGPGDLADFRRGHLQHQRAPLIKPDKQWISLSQDHFSIILDRR